MAKGKAKVQATRGQVFQRGDGWRFRIKAGNGEVIATGEAYRNRKDAEAAARALLPDDAPLEVQA
jgi:hypothetical protein